MAFYNDEDEEEQGQSGGGAQTTGPASGTLGDSAAAAPGAAAAEAPKAENFVGISQYINANKPQAEKLAGQVAGNVETKAQAADTAFGDTQNSFNQAADSQKVQRDDALLGSVSSNAESVTGDPNKVTSFTKMRDASYSGPQNLQDNTESWGALQSALSKARQAKDATKTEEGRMGLIKEISNNPRQSQGALTFDNLLLQSNPNAAGQLQAAGSNLNDFDQRLNDAQAGATTKAQTIKDENAATKTAARGAVTKGFSNLFGADAGADGAYGTADDVNLNLDTSLSGRAASKKSAQEAAYNEMLNKFQQRQYTPEELTGVTGLNPDSLTYSAKLPDYLSQNANANTKNIATEEDYLRQAALQDLMGDGTGPTFLNEATDRELMGTADDGYDYDQAGLQGKIGNDRTDYGAQYNSIFDANKDPDPAFAANQRKMVDWIFSGGPQPIDVTPGSEGQAQSAFLRNNPWAAQIGELAQRLGANNNAYTTPTSGGGGGLMGSPMSAPLRR